MVILAAILAAAAAWLGVAAVDAKPRAAGRAGTDPAQGAWRWEAGRALDVRSLWWSGSSPRRSASQSAVPGSLEMHVRALRQLASLLRSGRPPVEAWRLLETATLGTASAPASSSRLPPGQRPGRNPGPPAPSSPAALVAAFPRPAVGRPGGGRSGETAGPDIAGACRAVAAAHSMGAPPSAGLDRHLDSCPAGYALVWVRVLWCIRISEGTGAALAELLGRLAGQLEARDDRARALESALAGPRATQRMLGWLPAFGIGLAQLLGAQPLALLLGTPVGQACLVAGTLLWLANRVWSRRLLAAARGTEP